MDQVLSAPMAGYFRPHVELLQEVQTGHLVGTIHDPLGNTLTELHAQEDGIVIMRRGLHRVHGGDGLIHLTQRAEE
jgi:predicted deacylase